MSNGVAAAITAGVLSFGAALGASFIMFGNHEDVALQATLSGIEKRMGELETNGSGEPAKVVKTKPGASTNDLNAVKRELNDKIDTKFAALDAQIKALKTVPLSSGEAGKAPDLEALKASLLLDMQGNFNELAANRDAQARADRETERARERVDAIEKVRAEGPQALVDKLTKVLADAGVAANDMPAFKSAYAARLERLIQMDEEVRQAGDSLDREAFKKRYDEANANDTVAFKAALGDAAYEKAANVVTMHDFSQARTVGGAAWGASRAEGATGFGNFRRGGNNPAGDGGNNPGRGRGTRRGG